MKKVLAVAATALVLTGCGGGDTPDRDEPSTPAPTSASPTAEPSASADVPAATDLLVAPGAIGAARVGMSVEEAKATGLFVDADTAAQGCPSDQPLGWAPPLDQTFDVFVSEGRITSMGVRAEGPKNAEGLGVGSTLADFRGVYETAEMYEAGYGQTGMFLSDGNDWLGILFDAPLDGMRPETPVTFMEVTGGEGRPALVRDGC